MSFSLFAFMLAERVDIVEFTYEAYRKLVMILGESGYVFCGYSNVYDYDRTVIMRHDVDFDLEKACTLAALEEQMGVESTYFVLVATDFYNLLSKNSRDKIRTIISLGHDIGLHFDETQYAINSIGGFQERVMVEAKILSDALDYEINVVSMHRPSQAILKRNIKFQRLVNSYSPEFFVHMKYLSDSRMFWREDVIDIVMSRKYDRLHILTHPFWYSVTEESLEHKLIKFLNLASIERYNHLDTNFRGLNEVIKPEVLISG